VTVMERTNVRDLDPADIPFVADLVVADLSFISLRLALPSLRRLAAEHATFVLLVKPQFEAGPSDVGRGGVVRDPAVWLRVLGEVVTAAEREGLHAHGAIASPVRGPAGNVEFLVWLSDDPAVPASADLDSAVAEGEAIAT
jgi:23S rRNA (cytidine1920-2'-O)/16S rRNA (cytidine1409-2'-O)-methyltransferase